MSVKEITELSLTDFWKEYQSNFKDFWQDSDEAMKAMRKVLIEEALKVEQWEYIGCSEYERSPLRQATLVKKIVDTCRHLSRKLCLGIESGIKALS